MRVVDVAGNSWPRPWVLAELRGMRERVEELSALLAVRCVVKDFTQCAAACAHRIMRHKAYTAQCQARLQRRAGAGGCADCTLQTARVVARDRLAMRRTTYSLLTSALHARDGCAAPGRATVGASTRRSPRHPPHVYHCSCVESHGIL